ncbi:hypothetical protein B9Z55_017097 [Caenorhabditis nigoni]|uniref:Uncharacterized protein n=1 Tax=Caenorhabditis nigoni TaxID=1611254 RepID=A0A2G5T7X8_9PELO|nr:hypothetical protein B9Z55_017097 [Caenorhabditis nigoni]
MNNGQSSTSNGFDPKRIKEEMESEKSDGEEISSATAQRLFQDVMADINVEMAELQHEIELFTPEEQAWINDQAVINLKDVQKTVAFARRKDMEHTTNTQNTISEYQKMLLEQKRKALKTFKKRLEQNTRYNPGRVAKSRAAETAYPSDDEIEVLHEKVVKKKKSKKK